MRSLIQFVLSCVLLLQCANSVSGDVLFYDLPNRNKNEMQSSQSDKKKVTFILQGTTTKNPGRTTTFQHPKFGKIHFESKEIDVKMVPTPEQTFLKMLAGAGKNGDRLMDVAHWALRHGLLPQFYQAVDKALAADPKQKRAILVKELKEKMEAPIGDSSEQEKEMRALIGGRDMRSKESKHFILLYDTSDKLQPNRKLTRAEERLQLLEAVYESFLLRFYAHGIELDVPTERLKVILFREHKDYNAFATKLSPSLASTGGFWDGSSNTSVFFDQGTRKVFKELSAMSEGLQAQKAEALRQKKGNNADLVRLADTIAFLVEIERENEDIKVVSHEATHQMAGNTGLLPRHVLVPSWVHEGLAAYFETSEGASWGGVGAVNAERLEWYRELARDREHSNIDFIVGDQIFDFAKSSGARLHGYAQAWALTHFLMERKFTQFVTFYRRLGEMPPHLVLSAEVLTALFHETIPQNPIAMDGEWRQYMDSLKTDLEVILGERERLSGQ